MAATAEAQDWTQWMQWDGEEQPSSSCQSDPARPKHNALAPPTIPSVYPVSPTSTANSDSHAFPPNPPVSKDPYPHTDTPLTPSHTSSSPETRHPPDHRLSGETLRSTSSADLSRPPLKRKLSEVDRAARLSERAETQGGPQVSKKRPHNVIEKRYRANLNEKIAELRQSVPSLRGSPKGSRDSDDGDDGGEEQAGSTKLNKASILTKAVEYIRHLELRNRRLDDENLALKQRLLKLERVMASDGNRGAERATAFTSQNAVEDAAQDGGTEADAKARASKHPPQGLLPVPESMRKLRQNQPQEHYANIYDTPPEGQRGGLKWPARLIIGSLAGLMVLDGFSKHPEGSDSKDKGLFGIPLEFMDGWWFFRSPHAFIAAFMQYCRAGGVVPLIKGFMALSMLAFIVFAYLFNSKPIDIEPTEELSKLPSIPSLASPIEVRRQAWSASTQTLKLPHHSFFPEWLAVTMEWLKYTVRLVFGFPSYYWLTGRSGEDELTRIKAWDIAIDAQLAGGDPEISRSRLVLSIFASGTLPQTPTRLMLKALHCRVVLWKVGRDGGVVSRTSNKIATFLAHKQWQKAHTLAAAMKPGDEGALPPHLFQLLSCSCGEVLLEQVLERAYNLMYDRTNNTDCTDATELMDIVVEDHAIRSPLDAIAAWWSSQKLHEALVLSMSESVPDKLLFQSTLDIALSIAPPLSAAHTRAVAIKAVFFKQGRAMNAQKALSALPNTSKSPLHHNPQKEVNFFNPHLSVPIPVFIDSSLPLSAVCEVSTVLDCANAMMELDRGSHTTGELKDSTRRSATELFLRLNIDEETMTILSFAPLLFVLGQLLNLKTKPMTPEPDTEELHHHHHHPEPVYELLHTVQILTTWAHKYNQPHPRATRPISLPNSTTPTTTGTPLPPPSPATAAAAVLRLNQLYAPPLATDSPREHYKAELSQQTRQPPQSRNHQDQRRHSTSSHDTGYASSG